MNSRVVLFLVDLLFIGGGIYVIVIISKNMYLMSVGRIYVVGGAGDGFIVEVMFL